MSVTFCVRGLTDDSGDEINMANGNFKRIMDLLGYPDADWCAIIKGEDLDVFEQRVHSALETIAAHPELDGTIERLQFGTPEEIPQGNTSEVAPLPGCPEVAVYTVTVGGYYSRQLTRLAALITVARARGEGIRYS